MHLSFIRPLSRPGARRILVLATVAALALGGPTASRAADPTVAADHEQRIKELEDTIKQLKKDTRNVEATLEGQKPLVGWSDGFNLSSADGKSYKLRIGGYTQADGRFFIDDSKATSTNQFLFRRARLDISGTVAKYFDFRILPDFVVASNGSFQFFDAYVDFNYFPAAKLRVGKFKPPVGLERLQSATSLQFVERGQPSNLVPNRDNGVQLFGDLLNGALSYQLGVFNGVPDNVNPTGFNGDADDDKDFAGRVFTIPFKDLSIDPLKGFGLGLAGSYGRQRGTSASSELPSFKSFGQNSFFSYSGSTAAVAATGTTPEVPGKTVAFAFGQRERYSPQFFYYWGPLGVIGEYAVSAQSVRRDTVSAANKVTSQPTTKLSHDAWSVGAAWVISGENATYKGVAPAQPFDPFTNTWGAWEVAARYGQLEVDPDAFSRGLASATSSARRDKEWVLGLNWYLNKNIKLVLNYGHTDFRGGAATGNKAHPIGNRPSENAIFSRVQLVL